jgi:hypothetical protein
MREVKATYERGFPGSATPESPRRRLASNNNNDFAENDPLLRRENNKSREAKGDENAKLSLIRGGWRRLRRWGRDRCRGVLGGLAYR